MSLDTVSARPSDTATTTPPDPDVAAREGNAAVIAAIRAHHAQLAEELRAGTDAVLRAVRTGDAVRERDALHDWYRTELLPHAAAEEQVLYRPADDLDATRLLVRGMVAEHRHLERLVADLGLASGAVDVAAAAVAARSLFAVHLAKENDLLLPALDAAGLDLGSMLEGMHEILGHAAAGAPAGGGCGCGCGCGHDHDEAPLQIGSAPDPLETQTAEADDVAPDDLDVRTLPHAQRHEIIFSRLDRLGPGEALVIVNDHDPKPLRYQTSAMWPDRYEWTYSESGPVRWRVAITRVG